MRITFSNQGSLSSFNRFAESLDFSDPRNLEIILDENWTSMNPAQLVLAAALAVKVGKTNTRIIGTLPASVAYLTHMGLYDFISTPSPIQDKAEPSGRFVPITSIKTSFDQTKFITDIIPLLHLNEKNSRILSYLIGELVRNTLEHAYSKDGAFVAAQYNKNTNHICFAICDTGIGLWRSLKIWKPKTDEEALSLALTPGISGTTLKEGGTSDNAGAGLFFTKSIVKISKGHFVIYSGNASYTLLKQRPDLVKTKLFANPFDDPHSFINTAPRFDGTLVAFDFSLDATDEFQTLLNQIGIVYESAIEARKKSKVRKPNFI